MTSTQLTGVDARGADFSGAKLYEVDLTQSRLAGDRFDGADLENVNIYGSRNIPVSFKGEKDGE